MLFSKWAPLVHTLAASSPLTTACCGFLFDWPPHSSGGAILLAQHLALSNILAWEVYIKGGAINIQYSYYKVWDQDHLCFTVPVGSRYFGLCDQACFGGLPAKVPIPGHGNLLIQLLLCSILFWLFNAITWSHRLREQTVGDKEMTKDTSRGKRFTWLRSSPGKRLEQVKQNMGKEWNQLKLSLFGLYLTHATTAYVSFHHC